MRVSGPLPIRASRHGQASPRGRRSCSWRDPMCCTASGSRRIEPAASAVQRGVGVLGSRQEQERRLREMLDHVGLPDRQRTATRMSFSGGQRQRLGSPRALIAQTRADRGRRAGQRA